MQTLAVVTILAIAMMYLAGRLLRFFRKAETGCCGCSCDGCMTGKSGECGLPVDQKRVPEGR